MTTLVHSAQTIGYPTKLQGERYWVPCTVEPYQSDRLKIKFGYNKYLLGEIKTMAGARWEPNGKFWHVLDNTRNWFQLAFLTGHNPYEWFDRPLVEHSSHRPLYPHQFDMARHGLTYHYGIWAAEMGTGKSLAAIEIMEASGLTGRECLYVGPRSAMASFQLELSTWKSKVYPVCVTYDGLKKMIADWEPGTPAPKLVIFDESSRVKNPTAQRSQAAYHLAEAVRRDHGDAGYVILMSGSPAPKSPADWFWQAEIAMPGFIKEGTYEKFKARLGLIVLKDSLTGGSYPHLVTWRDDEKKCDTCGLPEDDYHHEVSLEGKGGYHTFVQGRNEVAYLYQRMKGLVEVKFKKDCLKDLPDKRYREIECKPRQETVNAAKLILAGASTTISGLTLLRELSDGFQYQETPTGTKTCEVCHGAHLVEQPIPIVDQAELNQALEELMEKAGAEHGIVLLDPRGVPIPEHLLLPEKYEMAMVPCWNCGGEGTVTTFSREAVQVPCPKEEALKEIIDSHEEDGRLVTYAGFTGSVERVTQIFERVGWEWVRVDGRGWKASPKLGVRSPVEYLKLFQRQQAEHPRVGFVGQPSAAGMGLTLTASCEIVYFSNDFNAESRIQSEDRIHRPSMDLNKGALITDLIHLPTDKQILDNLKKKRKLQNLSLGHFADALKTAQTEVRRY